jgi:hypothetical protein
MPFKPVTSGTPVPNTPLELFDELPRMAGSFPELWRQQGDVLREYMRAFDQKRLPMFPSCLLNGAYEGIMGESSAPV